MRKFLTVFLALSLALLPFLVTSCQKEEAKTSDDVIRIGGFEPFTGASAQGAR